MPLNKRKGQAFSVAFLLSCALFPLSAQAQTSEPKTPESKSSEQPAKQDLSGAAESLSQIIREAKRAGLVQSHHQEKTEMGAKATKSPSNEPSEAVLNVNAFDVAGCDAASVLDFSSMKNVSKYEDVLSAGEKTEGMDKSESAIWKAKVYLSLGLGVEARSMLSSVNSEEANLLRHAAEILEHPDTAPQSLFFLPYSDCGEDVFFWTALDTPDVLQADITGQDRRRIIAKLDNYPPRLKDFFAVHFAIRAAENGRFKVANGIWNKLEREARDNQSLLPSERYDEDEVLYLKGLLEREADIDYAFSIFSHLAEREGLYRLPALKNLNELNLENKAGEAVIDKNLIEISEKGAGSIDGKVAAFELVKNRVHSGDAEAAILVVKKYFELTDENYIAGAEKIRELVEFKLTSVEKLTRLQGLNAFLTDKTFYAVTGSFTDMEVLALQAAFESGLPELHAQILLEEEPKSPAANALLEASKLFAGIKSDSLDDSEIKRGLKYLDEDMVFRIGRYAVAEGKTNLAEHIAGRLKNDSQVKEINQSLAITDKRWDDLANIISGDNNEDQAHQETVELMALTVEPAVTTRSPQWFTALPAHLDKIDKSIRQTEDYLNNG
jgi:predicted transcriptional regulator